jgi:hypothetical protein
MKWFLILWTVGCLAAMNWLFPNYWRDTTGWVIGNALCVPFFFGMGYGLFASIGSVFEKLRKVHP